MTSKPKSGRALCLSVAHCSHPDLDPTDKALLLYLAVNADYETGGNSRPGNPSLCDATTLKRSALNDRLEKNIQRELIERTTVGDGRGKASAYRIRIESSFFPEQTPTGERLIEKVSGSSRTDSENKPSGSGRTDSTETVRQSQGNCPAESEKLSGQPAEIVRELPEHTNTAPETHQHHTNNSITKPSGQLPEWVVGLFGEFNNHEPLRLRKTDPEQFMAAIKQHGEQVMELAWNHFVHVGTYNTETKCPAYLFFNDLGVYIEAARRKMQSHSWRSEHDPQYAAAVEANIQQQMREDWERMNRAPAPQNGGSVHEYLAALEE